jgi:hypothetical protein
MIGPVKPGERIRLIRESTNLIARHPEREIQLILGQHGIETINTWDYQGDLEAYAQDRLEGTSDRLLRELHAFLTSEIAEGQDDPILGDPWTTNLPARVFISHVHHDKVLAGNTKRVLAARYGVDAFVAHDDITPSRTWREQIKRALATCHYFVALLRYPEYHDSQWCDQEVGWALARRIPILPVRPVGFDRSAARDGFLEEHQDISLDSAGVFSHDHFVAFNVLMGIVRAPSLREIAPKVLAEAFVNSRSYDSTRRIWELIEAQPQLESETLRRLEYAVQTNAQVYEGNRDGKPIPALVKELVEKFEPPADDEPPF